MDSVCIIYFAQRKIITMMSLCQISNESLRVGRHFVEDIIC
jgi:hypothetical protein